MLSVSRRSHAPDPPDPPSLPVLGWVVCVWSRSIADGGWRVTGLTNSDISDRETAEHEAAVWRQRAVDRGESVAYAAKQYRVRPVIEWED